MNYEAVCAVVDGEKKTKRKRPTKNTFCYCCGTRLHLTDHHLKPRSEGGTDHPDNIVTVCADCHDEVEGPADGAWERVVQHKESIKTGRIAKTKEERLRENREWREKQQEYDRELRERKAQLFQRAGGATTNDTPVPLSLAELRIKRRAQGYLDPVDGRRYWSLTFGEEQARFLFDAPLQDWVENVVDRACGRATWRKRFELGGSMFSPDQPPKIQPESPEMAPEEPETAPSTQELSVEALHNAQGLWNGPGIGENSGLQA